MIKIYMIFKRYFVNNLLFIIYHISFIIIILFETHIDNILKYKYNFLIYLNSLSIKTHNISRNRFSGIINSPSNLLLLAILLIIYNYIKNK